MGNGALPNGSSYRAHPRLYHFGLDVVVALYVRSWGAHRTSPSSAVTSESHPGCVNTCTRRECAELFSLFSSFDGDCQSGSFLIQRNRDKLSTRKFDVGVFTQPGSKTEVSALPLHFRFTPTKRTS